MKKLFVLLAFSILSFSGSAQDGGGDEIPLTVEWDDPTGTLNPLPKSPVSIPSLFLLGHSLCFMGYHAAYVLQIWDMDSLVYSTYVPAGTTTIIIPASLSGSYEIRLVADTYYYRGYVSL